MTDRINEKDIQRLAAYKRTIAITDELVAIFRNADREDRIMMRRANNPWLNTVLDQFGKILVKEQEAEEIAAPKTVAPQDIFG